MMGKYFKSPDPDVKDRVPPGQYLATGFPVLTYGETPQVEQNAWTLTISGLAEPKTFTWQDLMALPQSDFTADFHCVTRWSKLDVKWTGVKITDLMGAINLEPKATHVMQHCTGGYSTNLSLDDFVRDENCLAHTLFGEPLDAEHGGPVRSLVPHLYAWKSAKWISELEFMPADQPGFWERNGYHYRGEPWAEERFS